jgi:hypothetical protein
MESDNICINNNNREIKLISDTVYMTTGSVCEIVFCIKPYSAVFDSCMYEENYIFKLMSDDDGSRIYEFKIKDIKQLGGGMFVLSVEDLYISKGYKKRVKLVLNNRYTGEVFYSNSIYIKYDSERYLVDTGLPLLKIETINHEEPTCDYVSPPPGCWGSGITNTTKVPGRLVIIKDKIVAYDSGFFENGNSGLTLKIRGNTSAYGDKKPYKIKLEQKADLLLRGDEKYKDKEWLLLRYDGLRSLVGFKLNELLELQWTPSFQFVNLMINGDNRGLYILIESVKRNPQCRLNVCDKGFIIEYDAYWWNEDVYFESKYAYPMNYTFKYPKDDNLSQEQIEYIKSYIDLLEICINEDGEYERYIDVLSWAKWLLAHDILGTWDSGGSNVFITKYDNTEASKLMMANLWDFDTIYTNPVVFIGAHIDPVLYFQKLLNSKNDLFKSIYKDIWAEKCHGIFSEIEKYLTNFEKSEYAESVNKSIINYNRRWGSGRPLVSDEISKAKSWFSSRKAFLDKTIPTL